ncbi:hypothetical protein BKA70DRAFT_786500 [Coprinopsis sp. MPI-PUGE-AT-0042]|nr:hypothetical protein BKA70DRAFT_786500 [Coprinopsis sp. MPI-PUGE-AT-0042]
MAAFTVKRVENPTDEEIEVSVDLFVDLMSEDRSVQSLVGSNAALIPLMIRAMLWAGALEGEYYIATDEAGNFAGYSMWMPPGRDLFGTDAQRALGLNDFMEGLSDSTKDYWKNTYIANFPGFVQEQMGPTGKTDAWWLHQAMVRKEFQRQGVAKALIEVVLKRARDNRETLGTTTTSDENISVYTALNFKHKATKMMPSPLGEWPIHLFELRTADKI